MAGTFCADQAVLGGFHPLSDQDPVECGLALTRSTTSWHEGKPQSKTALERSPVNGVRMTLCSAITQLPKSVETLDNQANVREIISSAHLLAHPFKLADTAYGNPDPRCCNVGLAEHHEPLRLGAPQVPFKGNWRLRTSPSLKEAASDLIAIQIKITRIRPLFSQDPAHDALQSYLIKGTALIEVARGRMRRFPPRPIVATPLIIEISEERGGQLAAHRTHYRHDHNPAESCSCRIAMAKKWHLQPGIDRAHSEYFRMTSISRRSNYRP